VRLACLGFGKGVCGVSSGIVLLLLSFPFAFALVSFASFLSCTTGLMALILQLEIYELTLGCIVLQTGVGRQ
jgi:uncharacterized protein YhhL (DUF1145 family)